MKYYEMYDMYCFLRDELHPEDTPEWRNYKEKMEKFFEELKPYFKPDNLNRYKAISEEDYKRLEPLFDEVTEASNDFTNSYKNIIEPESKTLPPIKEVALNFNNEFLAKAYVEYKNIKPNPNFSLKDQMEDFRYISVQMSSNDIKKLGAAQSDRTQMKVNINGQEVKGVFTNKTFFDGKKEYEPFFPRMAEKYPKYAKFFNGIDKERFYKNGIQDQNPFYLFNKDKNFDIYYGETRRTAVVNYINSMNLTKEEKALASNFIFEDDFYEAMVDFSGELGKIATPIVIGKDRVGMKEGERIDMRNSAMSGVANLIGCPNVIANSRPIAVYDENGKKYDEGTFMEFATGKDYNNLDAVDEMRLMKLSDFETTEAKQSIADLQVLDYICGNIDRHVGNMFYNVDPKTHKLKGVVGIDNDSSFTKNDIPQNKGYLRLPGVNNLRVINEKTANSISKLTEGQLKATLHGFGLDDASIKAAWKRVSKLKEAIRNGKEYANLKHLQKTKQVEKFKKPYITIVKKEDWKKISFSDVHDGASNYFKSVEGVSEGVTKTAGISLHTSMRKESALAGMRAAMGKSQTEFLYTKAKNASPWFFASTRYKNIITKVKEYHEEKINGLDMSEDNEKKWQKLGEVKDAINVYKREKIRDGFIDENWNMKKPLTGKDLERMLLVKGLETYAERMEKEKKVLEDMKLKYSEEKRKAREVNKFVLKDPKDQAKLVKEKQEALEKEQLAKQQEVIVANEVSNNVSASIPNLIEENNNLIKKEEVEINKPQKEVEEKEKKAAIQDIEKEM